MAKLICKLCGGWKFVIIEIWKKGKKKEEIKRCSCYEEKERLNGNNPANKR